VYAASWSLACGNDTLVTWRSLKVTIRSSLSTSVRADNPITPYDAAVFPAGVTATAACASRRSPSHFSSCGW
jgi:hypothetical protein